MRRITITKSGGRYWLTVRNERGTIVLVDKFLRLESARNAADAYRNPPASKTQTALCNCQSALQTAIKHLQTVLNECRTADDQLRADTAAREWLASIGAD